MVHLNKEQIRAVRHKDGPLLVLAGPGSGKTAVLTEHIRFLIREQKIDPARIMALTFSKKAALSMQKRLKSNDPVTFGTFHSVFYNVLRRYNSKEISLISEKEQIRILSDIGRKLKNDEEIDRAWCFARLEEIGRYKNTGKMPSHIPEEEAEFEQILKEYGRRLGNAGLIDFDDMIINCVLLFQKDREVLAKLQDRFLHILVDEFQDCNDPQYELLQLLSAKHHNLFLVGDDDQSIYGFRGANSGIVRRFTCDHPQAETVHLIRNYRCSPEVIDHADRLIRKNSLRIPKPKQMPSSFREQGTVEILEVKNAAEEAMLVAAKVRELLDGGLHPADIAVLYRTKTVAAALEECLKKAEIPCGRKKEGFLETDIVKKIFAYLELSQYRYQRPFFYEILNHPERDLVRECIAKETVTKEETLAYYADDPVRQKTLAELFSDLERIHDLPPFAALHYIWKKIGLGKGYEDNTVLLKLSELSRNYRTVDAFLEGIRLEQEKRGSENRPETGTESGVVLQTIHASKGLEYDTVFVIGLQDGILPHKKAMDLEEREEERRLLYVAMTRAVNRLYLLARGNREIGKRISPFIDEIVQ